MKTRALMSIASDDDHVISVMRFKTLQEAVQRVVYIDIGRCNVIGFQRIFTTFHIFLFHTDHFSTSKKMKVIS